MGYFSWCYTNIEDTVYHSVKTYSIGRNDEVFVEILESNK